MIINIQIYTDGGCTGNPGPGGWAAIILQPNQDPIEISGGDPATTNNRMELTAVIQALESIRHIPGNIEVITDSQYVRKGINEWMENWLARAWKNASGKPVKNRDLWTNLQSLNAQRTICWSWVRGHSGNHWNERCDRLVAAERKQFGKN